MKRGDILYYLGEKVYFLYCEKGQIYFSHNGVTKSVPATELGYSLKNSQVTYDEDGYDEDGYDKDGFNKEGYNKYGFDKDGFDKDGYSAF